MKQGFKTNAILIGILSILVGCILSCSEVSAKEYKLKNNYYGGSCSVVISKDKVYYSITETGCIYCYNMKTKKTKTVAKAKGNGFSCLKKKGNYLYAVYDSYQGSDGCNLSIVRVSIKSGKKTTLAKGCNYILAGNKIYYTKTKRVKSEYGGYDKELGTYSMTLTGKNKKSAKGVKINTEHDAKSKIIGSKGSLYTKGKTKNNYYMSKSLHFDSRGGKSTVIYDILSDSNATTYATIEYYTLQGNYIVYKKNVKDNKYGAVGQLVLVKTDGTNAKVIYSRPSVSGW